MKRRLSIACVQSLLVLGVIVLGGAAFAQDKGLPVSVRIETEAGNIIAELHPDKAPATVANFLRYVDGGSYNGGCFMRTVRPDNEQNPALFVSRSKNQLRRDEATMSIGR